MTFETSHIFFSPLFNSSEMATRLLASSERPVDFGVILNSVGIAFFSSLHVPVAEAGGGGNMTIYYF